LKEKKEDQRERKNTTKKDEAKEESKEESKAVAEEEAADGEDLALRPAGAATSSPREEATKPAVD